MVKNDVDPYYNSSIQRFFYGDIPTIYQYLTGITILIPMGRFFDNLVDVDYLYHAFTFIPVQH